MWLDAPAVTLRRFRARFVQNPCVGRLARPQRAQAGRYFSQSMPKASRVLVGRAYVFTHHTSAASTIAALRDDAAGLLLGVPIKPEDAAVG